MIPLSSRPAPKVYYLSGQLQKYVVTEVLRVLRSESGAAWCDQKRTFGTTTDLPGIEAILKVLAESWNVGVANVKKASAFGPGLHADFRDDGSARWLLGALRWPQRRPLQEPFVCAMNITGRDAGCLAEALLHRDSRTLLSRPKHPGSHVPRPRIALNAFIPESLESPDFPWWLAGLGRGGTG